MNVLKISAVVLGLMLMFACDLGPLVGDPGLAGFILASSDAGAAETIDSSRSVAAPGGLKISFRSSDIEFWATGGSFDNLRSLKYHQWSGEIAGANVSTEIGLSDTEDNIIFMPNKVKISDYDMPQFDRNLAYDVARMDIGSGNINFTMNGSTMDVSNSTLGDGSLNANSIVFIDRNYLTSVVYVPRTDSSAILNDYFDNGELNGSYDYGADTAFILDFVVENTATWIDSSLTGKDDAYMDVDGALFVPFDPVDFTGKNDAKMVKISLEWDLNSIFTAESGGSYTLADTADGTPFNFDVSIEVK
jgi:hypothetical protein